MSLTGNAYGKTLVGTVNKCEVMTITAYEIALKHGFKGTEEEWLASLPATDEQVEAAVVKHIDAAVAKYIDAMQIQSGIISASVE